MAPCNLHFYRDGTISQISNILIILGLQWGLKGTPFCYRFLDLYKLSNLYKLIDFDYLTHQISCIESAKANEANLDVNILLDFSRSNRIVVNSGDLNRIKISTKDFLRPLTKIGANVCFYLTPNMSGWRKWLVFDRQNWNELNSLHHIKCYIFDDNVIISGANLSHIYFTNRQDRYILFKDCPQLSNYFDQLIRTISSFSLQLSETQSSSRDKRIKLEEFSLHDSWSYHPLNYFQRNKFKLEAKERIDCLNRKFINEMNVKTLNESQTIVFPLIQMRTLGVCDDQLFTLNLLSQCNPDSNVRLASGYFNLTNEYEQIILSRDWTKPFKILMASEAANGFYGAKGVIANIPHVYTYLSKQFLNQLKQNKSNVELYEFDRNEWTFHAKGLWLSLDPNHYLSMVGSPNFGYRSVYRDTEAQLAIVTKDKDLQQRLENECNQLWKDTTRVVDQYQSIRIPVWVTLVANFMKSYF